MLLLVAVALSQQLDWRQIKGKPLLDPRDFNFDPIRIPSVLTGGVSSVITVANCPMIVSGGQLYISGTGTPEIVTINYTNCNPTFTGAPGQVIGGSGQIIFVPTNSHTLGATISSPTFGVSETLNYLAAIGSQGGTIRISAGNWPLYGQIIIPSNVHLIGIGEYSTTITLRSGYTGSFGPAATLWGVPGYTGAYAPIVFASAAVNASIRDMTIDKNGGATTYAYGGIIAGQSTSYIRLENLTLLNQSNAHLSSPVLLQGSSSHLYARAINIVNQPGCTRDGDGPGGFDFGGTYNQILDSYVTNACVAGYLPGYYGIVKGNTFLVGSGTMSVTNQAYSADSTSSSLFFGNICDGSGNSVTGPACYTATTDNPAAPADHNVFSGNTARNCGQGYQVAPVFANSTTHANNTIISGGTVDNCATGVFIGDYVNYLTVSDLAINNATQDGISTYTNGASTSNYIDIHDVTITNPGYAGILFNTSSGSTIPGIGYKIHHNTIIDNLSPHVMAIGIDFPRTLAYPGYEVTDNTVLGTILPQNGIYMPFGINTVAMLQGNTTSDTINQVHSYSGVLANRPLVVPITGAVTNDVAILGYGNVRLTAFGSAFSVSGFDPSAPGLSAALAADGAALRVCNFTGQTMTLVNQSGSTAGHQILTGTGGNVTATKQCVNFSYDATSSYWVLN